MESFRMAGIACRYMRSFVLILTFLAGLSVERIYAQAEPDPRGDRHFDDGHIASGAGYHGFSGRITRTVVDLVVPGSVGKYPLKLERTMRNWATNRVYPTTSSDRIGASALWVFNVYGYAVFFDETQNLKPYLCLEYPDGTVDRLQTNIQTGTYTFGGGDRVVLSGRTVVSLRLRDGGSATLAPAQTTNPNRWYMTALVDPHGIVYTRTASSGTNGSVYTTMTDPTGRWVRLRTLNAVPLDAETSNGEKVTYAVQDSATVVYGNAKVRTDKLVSASYDDGTTATYEYTAVANVGVFPYRCYDVRAQSRMQEVQYAFSTQSTTWNALLANDAYSSPYPLLSERVPGSTSAVSTRNGLQSQGGGVQFSETRNGVTRTFTSVGSPSPVGGRVASFTDFLGNTTTVTYTFQLNTTNNLSVKYTDPLGNATTVEYPAAITWQSTNSIENPLKFTFADGNTRVINYTDNSAPYYVSSITDERGNTTSYARDGNKRISTITYPDGTTETFTYNAFGQTLTHKFRNGASESFTYDARGNLTKRSGPVAGEETAYTYYDSSHVWFDRIKTETDARNNTTTYEYDKKFSGGVQGTDNCRGRGLVTKIIYADNNSKSTAYNKFGLKTSETNELGQTTTYSYDALHRVVSVTNAAGEVVSTSFGSNPYAFTDNTPSTVTSPAGAVTTYTYNANLRPIKVIEATGDSSSKTVKTTYDSVGNATKVEEQIGGTEASPTFRTVSFVYDGRGRKITEQKPLSRDMDWSYDAAGNVILSTNHDGTSTSVSYDSMNRKTTSTDEMNYTTTFTYSGGNLQKITDANGKAYTYEYDNAGRVTKLLYPDSTSESRTYDLAGNMVTFTNRSGKIKTLAYDSRNRPISSTWNDGVTPAETTTYDAMGKVATRSNDVSTISYVYDAANRLISETQSVTGGRPKIVTSSYNSDGARVGVTVSDTSK